MHFRPTELPEQWIVSRPLPDSKSTYASWIVLRKIQGAYPFVTHVAYWNDEIKPNEWQYSNGHYFEHLDSALQNFEVR